MASTEGGRPERVGRPARGPLRLVRAVAALDREQRIAAGAAIALWLSMFLPWYSKTVLAVVKSSLERGGYDLSAFGAFSFVEAAVLLVASATLALLFARAERRAFHLPGGDGLVILAGGIWVSVLIFYRMLDKPVLTGNDQYAATVGLQWGIFFALAASLSLAYAGARVRAAHHPEPSLRDDPTVPSRVASRRTPRRSPPSSPQSSQPPQPGSGPSPRTGPPPGTGPSPGPEPQPEGLDARLPPRPAARPFDADADADTGPLGADSPGPATSGFRPTGTDLGQAGRTSPTSAGDSAAPPTEDPPTRVVRRVPRFDDLDADWTPTDRLSLEADPPADLTARRTADPDAETT